MMLFSCGRLVRASFLCLPLLSSLPFPADAEISTAPDIQGVYAGTAEISDTYSHSGITE